MDKKKFTVYKLLHGRIGNFLFQTTCGMYYAKENNLNYKSVIATNLKDYLEIKDYLFPNIPFVVRRPDSKRFLIAHDEAVTKYTKIPNNFDGDILIIGCRESPKYFTKDFALNLYAPILQKCQKEAQTIYGDLSNTISVNVRRGDKLRLQDQYIILTKEWIEKALSLCDSSCKVIFTSDDIEWCKQNFVGDRFLFSDKTSSKIPNVLVDLGVQTLCKDNIISNGTFSWWGAYLNTTPNRKVIYSLPWYKKIPTFDVIPENDNWINIL